MPTDIERLKAHAKDVGRVARGRLAAAQLLKKYGFPEEAAFLERNACVTGGFALHSKKRGTKHD